LKENDVFHKTKLERVLESNPAYRLARNSVDVQKNIDAITEEVCAKLSPKDILAHTKAVYDTTALMYVAHEDHRMIIPELMDFMELPELPHGSRILDLGCGPIARDTLFFANTSRAFRAVFMGRRKNGIPLSLERVPLQRAYRVTAVDGSAVTLDMAEFNFVETMKVLSVKGDIMFTPQFELADMHDLSSINGAYDGVWSCAALFTHTPRELIGPALCSVAQLLRDKGIFGVSYPCGKEGMSYDSLLASRTGRIKYFSRPTPECIINEAQSVGLTLLRQASGDLVRGGEIKKDFFVTQFFQKQ
jgi:SAM-dependent methyltransferase